MARVPQQVIDRILATADIVEVVGEFMPLNRKGANYWGLSPFKQENTPSFSVSASKGIFKDFSSGVGGNVVTYLMEAQGMSYIEALKHLAHKYGIEWEFDDNAPDPAAENHREALLALNKFAAKWFSEQLLNTAEGRDLAGSYLSGRGFLPQTQQLFQLGYSPKAWEAFTEHATKRGYNPEWLQALGLSILSEKTGRPYDRFRGRAMFPLHDAVGRIVGFAGRLLDKDAKAAKYVNSPESLLYDKSNFLYGLYFAKQAIREQQEAILVEGYTDVISLHQAGIRNVVASSGTSLTEQQVGLVRRHTNRMLVVFDGDAAGVRASLRGIDVLVAAGMQVRVLPLPPAHDPDSFVRTVGPAGFRSHANAHAQDFLAFKIEALAEGRPTQDPQVKSLLVAELAQTLALMPDAVQRSIYQAHAASLLQVPEDVFALALERELDDAARRQAFRSQAGLSHAAHGAQDVGPQRQAGLTAAFNQRVAPKTQPTKPKLHPQDAEIVRLMVAHYEHELELEGAPVRLLELAAEEVANFNFEPGEVDEIKEIVLEAFQQKAPLPLDTLLNRKGDAVKDITLSFLTEERSLSPKWFEHDIHPEVFDANPARMLDHVLHLFKYRKISQLIADNNQKLASATDPAEQLQLLETTKRLNVLKGILGKALSGTGFVRRVQYQGAEHAPAPAPAPLPGQAAEAPGDIPF